MAFARGGGCSTLGPGREHREVMSGTWRLRSGRHAGGAAHTCVAHFVGLIARRRLPGAHAPPPQAQRVIPAPPARSKSTLLSGSATAYSRHASSITTTSAPRRAPSPISLASHAAAQSGHFKKPSSVTCVSQGITTGMRAPRHGEAKPRRRPGSGRGGSMGVRGAGGWKSKDQRSTQKSVCFRNEAC